MAGVSWTDFFSAYFWYIRTGVRGKPVYILPVLKAGDIGEEKNRTLFKTHCGDNSIPAYFPVPVFCC